MKSTASTYHLPFNLASNKLVGLLYVLNFAIGMGAVLSIATIIDVRSSKIVKIHAFQSIILLILTALLLSTIQFLAVSAAIPQPGALFVVWVIIQFLLVGLFAAGIIFLGFKAWNNQFVKIPIVTKAALKLACLMKN